MSPGPAPHTPLPLRGISRLAGTGDDMSTAISPASESDLSHVLITPSDDPASVLASSSRCSSCLFGKRPSFDRNATGPAAKRHRISPVPNAESSRAFSSQIPSNLDDRAVKFIESVIGYQTSILESQAAKLDDFILSTTKRLDRLAETFGASDGLAILAAQVNELVQEVRQSRLGGGASHNELASRPDERIDLMAASPRELSVDRRTFSVILVAEQPSTVCTEMAMQPGSSKDPVVTRLTSEGGCSAALEKSRVSTQENELDELVGDSCTRPQPTIPSPEPPCGTAEIPEPHEHGQQKWRVCIDRLGTEAVGSADPSWTGAVR